MFPRIRLASLLAAWCWLAAAVLGAQQPDHRTPDFAKGLLDRAAVLAVAATVTADRFPDADDVLVDDHIWTQYWADGAAITWDDTYTKVLTEKGRQNNRSMQFFFQKGVDSIELPLVEVIKPNGQAQRVDVAANGREVTDARQQESNIYDPNHRQFVVNVPDLEIGDVLHYLSRRYLHHPRVPHTYSDLEVFEYTSPIVHMRYEIVGPESLPLRHHLVKNEIPGTLKYQESRAPGQIRYTWDVRNVPLAHEEPQMPPLYTCAQRLLVSTIADWRDLSQWYWQLCAAPLAQTDPEMAPLVAKLTSGQSDPRAKVETIFRWVSQEIRYAGITPEEENRAPGYEPHAVKETFSRRHGVCRDKAALLVSLLQLAGLKAYPVLIHSGPKKDVEVPQPYFNHAVTAVELAPGQYLLMDSTDESTQQLFPAYLGNMSYLVAKPEGETLLTSPSEPADANLMEIATSATLAADGSLSAQTDLLFNGINDNVYRGAFRSWAPEQVRRYFEGIVKRAAAGATLQELRIEPADLGDMSAQLRVHLKYRAPDVTIASAQAVMVPPPFLGAKVGMANFILAGTGLEQRRFTFKTDPPCGVRETLDLDLGPLAGDTIALPAYEPVAGKLVQWQRSLARDGKRLKGRGEFKILVPEMSAEEYLALKAGLRTIEYNERKVPIFAPAATAAAAGSPAAGEKPDRIILEERVRVDVQDAHHWTTTRSTKAQYLTYAARKRFGEIKIDFNPVWGEARIDRLQTTQKDGKVLTVDPKEINLMDAPWVGAAPRYPAARRLVALVPGVEEGSVVEVQTTIVSRGRPVFAFRENLADFDPIVSKTVEVSVPKGLALELSPGYSSVAEGERVTYRWSVADRPAVRREEAQAPLWTFVPGVTVAESGNQVWPRLAGELRATLAAKLPAPGELAAETQKLLAGKDTPEARLAALRDAVATRVRQAGPQLNELPWSNLTPPVKTLADGYGNGPDRALLLFALLKEAGFAPEFVAVTDAPRPASVWPAVMALPSSDWLSGLLVRVASPAGDVYLGDTDQYAVLGSTPAHGALALDSSGDRLFQVQAQPGRRNEEHYELDITLGADGQARIVRTRLFQGTGYAAQKRQWLQMPPEERKRYYQGLVAELAQAARPEGDLQVDFSGYPGRETFAATVPGFAVRDGNLLYLTVPESLENLIALRGDTRLTPLIRDVDRRYRIVTRVALPAGFEVLLPAAGDVVSWRSEAAAGTVSVRAQRAPGQLAIEMQAELTAVLMPPAANAELMDLQRQLLHPSGRTILLRQTP